MDEWVGRNILVTGASRGIGKAICEELVRHGLTVIGVARDVTDVEQAAIHWKSDGLPGSVVPIKCDISDPDAIKHMFTNIKADPDLEGVDVLVNNAAVAMAEPILTGDPAMWKLMMETNILGPAVLTQEVVNSLAERGVDTGHIIFINSLAGHRVIPGNKELHMYSVTKFALRSLLEGVRLELRARDSRIRVSAISPGVVETDIFLKLFPKDEDEGRKYLSERKFLEGHDIAKAVTYILSQPPHVQVHDLLVRSTEQIP
ncbi:dehydrogenase/reductase SDR family member 11 [Elysia marginata]|uniref:Dehydrogenase/reductase SDR family member 11 n=1 Tax=Elysia marginata TaxID=1093978 RepID=A0AAV4H388_9GAST|nr:dehydrogenase/reductase SDR family member 11 [Elysia marginata]